VRVLFASSPLTGHVNPLLGAARMLASTGHDVGFYTGTVMGEAVERAGVRFFPLPGDVDFDLRDIDRLFPERQTHEPGLPRMSYDFRTLFIGPMKSQYRGLKKILAEFEADAIVYDHLFYGAVPMLFRVRQMRPALIGCGMSFLATPRQDGAPHGPALPFSTDETVRQAYRRDAMPRAETAMEPLQRLYLSALRSLGIEGHDTRFGTVGTLLADAFWQATVPSLEYPQAERDPRITFVGLMPRLASATRLPSWAHELEKYRKIVLVTQGTVANTNFDDLIRPALNALAGEQDTLVVATSGGRDIKEIGTDLPSNARVAAHLPFDWLLPKIDLMITNGGYGAVNLALAAGVPVVVAGSTEEKPEIAARIARSGAGIDLKTGSPDPKAILDAFHRVVYGNRFRARSRDIALEFESYDSARLIRESLGRLIDFAEMDQVPILRSGSR
jgi:MGT family glycosyltransferase